MIKTAVIGHGFSAKTFHLPFLKALPQFAITAISTRNKDEVATLYPKAVIYDDASSLITQTDADLIIITAPNEAHFPLAKLALEQGKHVLLEKPFVNEIEEGEVLITLAEQSGKVLTVYQNRRWDSDFITVKKMIESGVLGDIKVFSSHFDRFRPNPRQRWRELPGPGAGIWYDLGPHLIDQALCLFGLPKSVTGRCLPMREGSEVVDYFDVTLHYPDKEISLHSSPYSAEPNARFTVQGTKGSFVKVGLDPQEPRLIAGQLPDHESWAAETPDQYGIHYRECDSQAVVSELGGYQNLFIALAQAIAGKGDNPVPATDALNGIRIIKAAMKSSDTGRTVQL